MKDSRISIIIPVYKVEAYLRKCLDSVIGQTYRELEIILVDDGSEDNCGRICDEYAGRDERIRVIHQQNGGVSAARNAGLAIASGDYLGFVDSDDWIEPDMYAYLLQGLKKEGADIAVCGHYDCCRDKLHARGPESTAVCTTEEALRLLLKNDRIQNNLWDKLYRREMFQGIAFPTGRVYEDFAVMDRVFVKAQRVAILPGRKYHYLMRADSIAGAASLRNQVDHCEMAKQRYDRLAETWPQLRDLLAGQCVASAIGIWSCYLANPPKERNLYREQIREIAAFAKRHIGQARREMAVGPLGRAVMSLTPHDNFFAFVAAYLLGRLYRAKHGRNL